MPLRRAARPRRTVLGSLALIAGLTLSLLSTTSATSAEPAVENLTPPAVVGTAAYGEVLKASPGTWSPSDATYTYRWLRDGEPLAGATGRRYRPVLKDLRRALSVRVVATSGDQSGTATSEEVTVRKGTITNEERPTIDGVRRYAHTLVARKGAWSRVPDRVEYQWLRDGEPVGGDRKRRHLGLEDFGHRMSVQVTVRKEGFRGVAAVSRPTTAIKHRVAVRHRVTYTVRTKGRITASLATFKRQAQATFEDPRGWRGSGVAFRRVAHGGSFTLVLSEASQVPTYSSGCSPEWSCRVGRYVVINQLRWQNASPMWRQVGRSRRDYRHMVVNHETGHWLGHGHRSCPGGGSLAPVMQQQSKGLDGCRPNPWPTARERDVPRF